MFIIILLIADRNPMLILNTGSACPTNKGLWRQIKIF